MSAKGFNLSELTASANSTDEKCRGQPLTSRKSVSISPESIFLEITFKVLKIGKAQHYRFFGSGVSPANAPEQRAWRGADIT